MPPDDEGGAPKNTADAAVQVSPPSCKAEFSRAERVRAHRYEPPLQHTAAQLERRLHARQRCTPHDWSGHRDPLLEPKAKLSDASYALAAAHLLEHGLTPHADRAVLQALWRQGEYRRLAQRVVDAWDGHIS